MAITIKEFKINNTRTEISVDIELSPGSLVTSLTLWDESNYKDPLTNIDLSYKISGQLNTETFVISTSDANVSSFNGIYIMEIETDNPSDVPGIVGTISLNRFYSAIAQLLCNINLSCLNCNDNFQNALLLDVYLEAIRMALTLGRFTDAIMHLKKISLFTETCKDCDTPPTISTAGNIVSVGVIDANLVQ